MSVASPTAGVREVNVRFEKDSWKRRYAQKDLWPDISLPHLLPPASRRPPALARLRIQLEFVLLAESKGQTACSERGGERSGEDGLR